MRDDIPFGVRFQNTRIQRSDAQISVGQRRYRYANRFVPGQDVVQRIGPNGARCGCARSTSSTSASARRRSLRQRTRRGGEVRVFGIIGIVGGGDEELVDVERHEPVCGRGIGGGAMLQHLIVI